MNALLQQRYHINGNRPALALAPMAGVSDLPFRQICEQLGADYSVTEMAATAPQLLQSDKNQARLNFTDNAKVKILQIIGNDATQMANAAKSYAELGADIIDINLGCPAKKVSSKGAGSALLDDLDNVRNILTEIVKICPAPVTIKTRLGPNHDNYTLLAVAEMASNLGIELLTVHGRTRACQFSGEAQFAEIAKLKKEFPHLAVIANGDIDSLEKAQQVLEQTNCDGLMIGRASVGNPWLFANIRAWLDPQFTAPAPIMDKKAFIIAHIDKTQQFYGDITGVRFAKKHIQAYLQHLYPIHKEYRQAFRVLAKTTDADEQLQQLTTLLQSLN